MPRIRDPQRPPGSGVRCKSKEPLFELAWAQSSTCTDTAVRYRGERASFKRTKVLLGPRGSWWGNGCGLSRLSGEGSESCYAGRWVCFDWEVWMGEWEVTQGEEAWSRWRTQNQMELAGVGPPIQASTIRFYSYVELNKQNKRAKGKKRDNPRNRLLTIENKDQNWNIRIYIGEQSCKGSLW